MIWRIMILSLVAVIGLALTPPLLIVMGIYDLFRTPAPPRLKLVGGVLVFTPPCPPRRGGFYPPLLWGGVRGGVET